jgi:hypothetical protein
MAWQDSDEQRKLNKIDEWTQTIFGPRKVPAPAYIEGEPLTQLRRRILDKARPFVSAELQKLETKDAFGTVLDHIERQYMDSAAAELRSPTNVPAGTLREVVSHDQSGRPMFSYYGSPRAWMNDFCAVPKRLAAINAPLSFTKV